MKTRIWIVLAAAGLLWPVCEASAQRCLPGQMGVQVTAGTVDGLLLWDKFGAWRYHTAIAVTRYTQKGRYWTFGAGYLQKDYVYRQAVLPKMQFTAMAGYFVPLLHERSGNFALSAGVCALTGYESSNRGEKRLYDGATLLNPNAFIYGGEVGVQAHVWLCDRLTLLVEFRERCLGGSSIGRFHALLGLGIRVTIN